MAETERDLTNKSNDYLEQVELARKSREDAIQTDKYSNGDLPILNESDTMVPSTTTEDGLFYSPEGRPSGEEDPEDLDSDSDIDSEY
ncbi:MAG: hypothetical protein ABIO02_02695 [Patescibacteria group bacterium]